MAAKACYTGTDIVKVLFDRISKKTNPGDKLLVSFLFGCSKCFCFLTKPVKQDYF